MFKQIICGNLELKWFHWRIAFRWDVDCCDFCQSTDLARWNIRRINYWSHLLHLWTTTQQLTLCTSFLVIPSARRFIYTDSLYIFLRLCACLSVYWFTLARHSRSYFVPYQRGRIAPTVLKINPELMTDDFLFLFKLQFYSWYRQGKKIQNRCSVIFIKIWHFKYIKRDFLNFIIKKFAVKKNWVKGIRDIFKFIFVIIIFFLFLGLFCKEFN